uniref:Bm399, isoform c n=1 Tax=Brugia malayi TaxID=6279 RepID=A0A1I9G1H3_BRUMA|nr:Bm399, isoform c [Brugia malayi]
MLRLLLRSILLFGYYRKDDKRIGLYKSRMCCISESIDLSLSGSPRYHCILLSHLSAGSTRILPSYFLYN